MRGARQGRSVTSANNGRGNGNSTTGRTTSASSSRSGRLREPVKARFQSTFGWIAAAGSLILGGTGLSATACSAGNGADGPNGGDTGGSSGAANGAAAGAGAGAAAGAGAGAASGAGNGFGSGVGAGFTNAGDNGGDAGLKPFPTSTGEPECVDGGPPPKAGPPMPITIDNCPGNIDAGTANTLKTGSGSTSGMRLLYPYDGTVWPLGLLAPTLQWEQPGSASAVYIHMKSQYFEYHGCFGANAPLQLQIPQDVWKTAGLQSQGGSDPLTVEMKVMNGGQVIGPITQTWSIALGHLKGQLFYNTYTSPQAGQNGAVMRLFLGQTQPEVFMTEPPLVPANVIPTGPCWSCHSLSANGARMVAQRHQYPGGPYRSASFDLAANPGTNPGSDFDVDGTNNPEMGLGAVYPDGSKVLTMGAPGTTDLTAAFPLAPGNVPAFIGPKESALLDTKTGQSLQMNGWNVKYAKMPSFSPDGSLVTFNWHEDSDGHSLAVANFDTNTNTFSNVRVIYKHDTLYPGWPFITPDNNEVLFVLGNTADYVSFYPFEPQGRPLVATSHLWAVNLNTGEARQLARANGFPQDGAPTYLPRPDRDQGYEFFPTIAPVPAGGYFWLFFTSRRTYGNTITNPVTDAVTKKIWVSAINISADGSAIPDPSHPPFLLPGQELEAGNIRAFATLEPCKQDGGDCESGVECCGGQCWGGKCGPPPSPPPICMEPPPPPCSDIDDRCDTAADCCDPEMQCVRNICQIIEPPR